MCYDAREVMKMTVGDRIKQRRLELGMSQTELARKLGYKDRSTLSYIERNGETLAMSKVVEFADALHVTPQWLMGWDEDDTDPREALLQDAFDNPDRRILFSLNEKATDQQVKVAIQFMQALLGEDQ